MASLGLSSLTFSATAGEFCNPIPWARNNSGPLNEVHNQCANTRYGNIYPNLDACVAAEGVGQKRFDAYNGTVLWEVKTYNFNNWNDFFYDRRIPKDIEQAEMESSIARACNYDYWYAVGDTRHPEVLEIYRPGFYPEVSDYIEVDPGNCLLPDN
jgi:hypothetical protein